MERLTKIQIWLSDAEFIALRNRANNEYRHPRDQARHILRLALLGNIDQLKQENTGAVRQDCHAGVVNAQ